MIRGFGESGTTRHSVSGSPFVHLRTIRHYPTLSVGSEVNSAGSENDPTLPKSLIAFKTVPDSAGFPNIYPFTRAREKSFPKHGTTRHYPALAGQR